MYLASRQNPLPPLPLLPPTVPGPAQQLDSLGPRPAGGRHMWVQRGIHRLVERRHEGLPLFIVAVRATVDHPAPFLGRVRGGLQVVVLNPGRGGRAWGRGGIGLGGG